MALRWLHRVARRHEALSSRRKSCVRLVAERAKKVVFAKWQARKTSRLYFRKEVKKFRAASHLKVLLVHITAWNGIYKWQRRVMQAGLEVRRLAIRRMARGVLVVWDHEMRRHVRDRLEEGLAVMAGRQRRLRSALQRLKLHVMRRRHGRLVAAARFTCACRVALRRWSRFRLRRALVRAGSLSARVFRRMPAIIGAWQSFVWRRRQVQQAGASVVELRSIR